MSAPDPAPPDFAALEEQIATELRTAITTLADQHGDEPLAAVVLWADPYKGWYEVHVDTVTRNATGARARNAHYLELLPEQAADEDAWKTAMTTSRRLGALPFDPRYGEFTSADEPVHEFTISVDAFVRSPAYRALNQGGEDGWLEGHMRFVLARAIARLVAERAFDALPRGPQLYVGYAYPDSSDAIMVALVEDAAV